MQYDEYRQSNLAQEYKKCREFGDMTFDSLIKALRVSNCLCACICANEGRHERNKCEYNSQHGGLSCFVGIAFCQQFLVWRRHPATRFLSRAKHVERRLLRVSRHQFSAAQTNELAGAHRNRTDLGLAPHHGFEDQGIHQECIRSRRCYSDFLGSFTGATCAGCATYSSEKPSHTSTRGPCFGPGPLAHR